MAFSEFEKKKYEMITADFVERHRPLPGERDELDLGFRLKGQSIEIFEIRPLWVNPDKKIEEPVVKTTYVRTQNVWKIYWQRADLKWHIYELDPEVNTLGEVLCVVERDEYGCFWG